MPCSWNRSRFCVVYANKKLAVGALQASHIEAFINGEEPVILGPNAVLLNYGKDWNLQTITEKGNLGQPY